MTDYDTRVDPPRLRTYAADVDDAGLAVADSVTSRDQGLRMGDAPVADWDTITTIGQATNRWSDLVTSLGDQMSTTATNMVTTADGYTAVDANNARLIDKATY